MRKRVDSIVESLSIQRQDVINEASRSELIDLSNTDSKKFDILQNKCKSKGYEISRFSIGVVSKNMINPQIWITPINKSSNLPTLMLGWVEGKLYDEFQIVFDAKIGMSNRSASKQFDESEFRNITKIVLPLVSDLNKEKWEDYVIE